MRVAVPDQPRQPAPLQPAARRDGGRHGGDEYGGADGRDVEPGLGERG
jgi:hypothetical protein